MRVDFMVAGMVSMDVELGIWGGGATELHVGADCWRRGAGDGDGDGGGE